MNGWHFSGTLTARTDGELATEITVENGRSSIRAWTICRNVLDFAMDIHVDVIGVFGANGALVATEIECG